MAIEVADIQQSKAKTYFFPFLNGIRGISSLYVVFHHLIADGIASLSTSPRYLFFLRFGHEAVVFFIVLSGFVLTLPLVNLVEKKFPDGLGGFIMRRARRILPAYYVALLFLPIFFLAVELLKAVTGEGANMIRLQELFLSSSLFSHLLLLQNLKSDWISRPEYNLVLWSMATEWWIYFIFALLLVPIWRKIGIFAALAFSVLLGLVPLGMHLLGYQSLLGSPHLLGSFGLGMFTAVLIGRKDLAEKYKLWQRWFSWIAVLAVVVFLLIVLIAPGIREDPYYQSITDLLLSIACAAFIFAIAPIELKIQKPGALSVLSLKILESRPALFLGKISYSLYLTHLVFYAALGITLNLKPVQKIALLSIEPIWVRVFLVIPLLVLLAYFFYLFFEKPFLNIPALAKAKAIIEKKPIPTSLNPRTNRHGAFTKIHHLRVARSRAVSSSVAMLTPQKMYLHVRRPGLKYHGQSRNIRSDPDMSRTKTKRRLL
ncbi:MAG TPA: acyltransferase [Longilinea sp.]|nr:acyltransferase [Longilinea sp.]